MRIYISGKITGNPKYYDQFLEAEIRLKLEFPSATIFNPAKIADTLPKLKHEEYMKFSFLEMDMCDAVYFLKGYENSRGANQEYGYALAKDMTMLFEE